MLQMLLKILIFISGVNCFEVLKLYSCNSIGPLRIKKSLSFNVTGEVTNEIRTDGYSCLANCLHKGCRFVTATQEPDGYRCKQYDKPVLSENVTTNGEVAYLHDYCPCNEQSVCLPKLYINFDNQLVMQNYGATFIVHHSGLAISGSPPDKQYAVLARYPSQNCLTTPHLCPNGFTLAFYAKMGVNQDIAGVLTSRARGQEYWNIGYGFLLLTVMSANQLEYQIMTETQRKVIFVDMTYPSPWIHITMTYKHDTDSFHAYHDGIRRPESYSIESLDPEPLEFSEIVFGRVHVNLDRHYCNCCVDEVQIFEIELK